MNADEAFFLEELKAGVPAAFERLVEEFEGRLYRFFYFEHADHHLAEEQTAETFAQLVRSLRGMTGNAEQLRAFVFVIARRVNLRRFREGARKWTTLELAADVQDRRPEPGTHAADKEELERTMTAMGELEPVVRQTLLLRFVEGLALAEVAAALELPVGTVKSHIHRGRAQLKKLMFDREYEA